MNTTMSYSIGKVFSRFGPHGHSATQSSQGIKLWDLDPTNPKGQTLDIFSSEGPLHSAEAQGSRGLSSQALPVL